jgi:phospholipase D1/2
MDSTKILEEGRNCWRIARTERIAFLVDGQAYFSAFREAAARAQRSIFVLGWDVHSKARLVREGGSGELPAELGGFLHALVSRRRELQAYVLSWDFAVILAFEREPVPVFRMGWANHERLHFHLDGEHPVGASHHQKVVVIDDKVAFAGGFDLTQRRWDTPHHSPASPHRVDPAGEPYGPFHDVQVLVDGEAAAALGDLARERWRRATGRMPLPGAGSASGDPWPQSVVPELTRTRVGISRTEPPLRDRPEVHEVQSLYLDSIRAARRFIYLENQYFTSGTVAEALASRLREPEGPELVMVLPKKCSGWLEDSTMGVLRMRRVRELREADLHGRLRLYWPQVGDQYVNLHSKVFVADDTFLRIGSSNLSNRSLGTDTECDVALEAASARERLAIERFRCRLLGEHLGAPPETVAETHKERGSLIAAVEALGGSARRLVPLEETEAKWLEALLPEASLIDPEKPAPAAELIDEFVPYGLEEKPGRPVLRGAFVLLALAALTAAWKWTPLGEYLRPRELAQLLFPAAGESYAGFVVVAGYIAGSLVAFPVTILIAATALAFPPVTAFLYSLAGCLGGATATFWAGRALGRNVLRRIGGARLNRVSKYLAKQGILTIAALRLVPIAPFSLVNAAAGASHIRFPSFFLGTLLGMAPGIFVITVLENRLGKMIQDPQLGNIAVAVVIVVAVVVAGTWVGGRLRVALTPSRGKRGE